MSATRGRANLPIRLPVKRKAPDTLAHATSSTRSMSSASLRRTLPRLNSSVPRDPSPCSGPEPPRTIIPAGLAASTMRPMSSASPGCTLPRLNTNVPRDPSPCSGPEPPRVLKWSDINAMHEEAVARPSRSTLPRVNTDVPQVGDECSKTIDHGFFNFMKPTKASLAQSAVVQDDDAAIAAIASLMSRETLPRVETKMPFVENKGPAASHSYMKPTKASLARLQSMTRPAISENTFAKPNDAELFRHASVAASTVVENGSIAEASCGSSQGSNHSVHATTTDTATTLSEDSPPRGASKPEVSDVWAPGEEEAPTAAAESVEEPWDSNYKHRASAWELLQFGSGYYIDDSDARAAANLGSIEPEGASTAHEYEEETGIECAAEDDVFEEPAPDMKHEATSPDPEASELHFYVDHMERRIVSLLAENNKLKDDKLRVSRDCAKQVTIGQRLKWEVDRSKKEMQNVERRLFQSNNVNSRLRQAFFEISMMLQKYHDLGYTEEDNAVLGQLRYIINRLVESERLV